MHLHKKLLLVHVCEGQGEVHKSLQVQIREVARSDWLGTYLLKLLFKELFKELPEQVLTTKL